MWTGGAGGEAHRWVTGIGVAGDIHALLERFRDRFPPEIFDALIAEVEDDFHEFSRDPLQPRNSFVCHFRNFRERFHHGRRSDGCHALAPLSAGGLSNLSRKLPDFGLKTQRAYADVIQNCAPALNEMPFAKDYPEFAGRRPEMLMDLGSAGANVDLTGRVFRGDGMPSEGRFSFLACLELLQEEFEEGRSGAHDSGLLPQEVFEQAETLLGAARERKGFSHPVEGKPAASVILAARLAEWT